MSTKDATTPAADPTALPADATLAADSPPAPATDPNLVSYRVLPKGDGQIHTGEHDSVENVFKTFPKGHQVDNVQRSIAQELEDRGLVEILG